ncbi:MAG: chromate transporter [Psychrilyobacter sp.]|uniref:chromate transporter n=1 Tax=Psychrilyobacter sp. TaxID=2586924 RepID=UPI003C75957F
MTYFMTLLKLFTMYFKIGLFNFGGGLASIPLLQNELEKNGFMGYDEFLNVLSISQMTPGAIAMNTATFVGNKVAGIPGAVVATTALALPSIIVILILAKVLQQLEENIYKRAIFFVLKSLTTALILYAGYMIARATWLIENKIEIKTIAISLLMFGIAYKKKINPVILIISSGVLGYIGLYIM